MFLVFNTGNLPFLDSFTVSASNAPVAVVLPGAGLTRTLH